MKCFAPDRIFCICIMVIWMTVYTGISSAAQIVDANLMNSSTAGKPEPGIDDRIPQIKSGHSYLKVLSIDLLVPGGGHFYLGNYYSGAVFAGLKVISVFSFYYFYNDLEKKRDDYHSLQKDPSAGYSQIEKYRLEYERAHQHVAFAVIGTAAAYISSLIFNYSDIKIINERAIPAFDFGFSSPYGASAGDRKFILVFNLRV